MRWITAVVFPLILSPSCMAAPKAVSNEDIKDAILSLVRMIRTMSDKLERHEHRERQLGEQVKKALSALDKRGRAVVDDLLLVKTSIGQLGERLQRIENTFTNDDRDRGRYTVDPVQLQVPNVEDIVKKCELKESQMKSLEARVSSHLDSLSSSVARVETRLLEGGQQPDGEATARFGADWQDSVLAALGEQAGRTAQGLSELSKGVESLGARVGAGLEKGFGKLDEGLVELQGSLAKAQENILKTANNNNEIAVGFFEGLQKGYDELSEDFKDLGKVEGILVQTSDNVIDTKRRIEYGVQQIMIEIGDLVKLQGKDMNATMNRRFDGISETILDNQKGGLTNLSSKIETEISQVWRQIGIMYEQLTASAGALDKLQEQTETYVNGSLHTMDSMEGKVGLITARMLEVDENLNYLLGRFSLVTHEFNQIKGALANALDNIKNSFKSVQEKIEEVGPGPNPISSDPGSEDNNLGSL